MSTMIIGGSGNVGAHIALEILHSGETPIVFDLAPPPKTILGEAADKVKHVKGDMLNLAEIAQAIKDNNVKKIIQTASLLTKESNNRPVAAAKVNFLGTVNVLEACRLTDIEKMVYTSTSSVYGPTQDDALIKEDYPRRPNSFYGITKLASEGYCETYTSKYGLVINGLRLRLIYGPGQRTGISGITDEALGKPLRGQPAALPYDRSTTMYTTYVKDAARAHFLASKTGKTSSLFYNINSGATTIGELVDTVQELIPGAQIKAGREVSTTAKNLPQTMEGGVFDISAARQDFNYEPHYSIREGLKELLEYEKRPMKTSL
ncbi:MAG: NAD(P)-dependent oxidoreductase [Thaumarchaeota archaeon]|nr:NAD(P)-dependent oxidoreductase [Nitrososphaerota archaeon]